MSVALYWVRHGAHDQLGWRLSGRSPGVVLAEPGLDQARRAGRRLQGASVRTVYTSPLERTRQTAEAIARACGAELMEDEALIEIDFGLWSGCDIVDLDRRAAFVRWNAGRDQACAEDGESMIDVQARVLRWMEARVAESPVAVVAVSHADVIKAAVMVALGLSPRAHDRLEVSPGSITCIAGSPLGYRLMGLNEIPA